MARKRAPHNEKLVRMIANLLTYVAHDPCCGTLEEEPIACNCGLADLEQRAKKVVDSLPRRRSPMV